MQNEVQIRIDPDTMGELLIWTDIDPEHEQDFNQWYDQEHMQERAAIPGFLWSRRYVSNEGPRKYLALYRTETLHVFKSQVYQQAFQHQTEWSKRNFLRMQNTRRRVNAVTPLAGPGTGAAVTLLSLDSYEQAQRCPKIVKDILKHLKGVVAIKILTPDTELSTPLPSESTENRVLSPFMVIDATTLQNAQVAGVELSLALGLSPDACKCFNLLWDLQSSEKVL